MEFTILGPLGVRDGNAELDLGAPKVRRLLALLLHRAGEVVPVSALVDGLWAGRPPRTAVKNLQLYVLQLRRALADPDRVVHRRPGYLLVVNPGELDVRRFEELADQARTAHERRNAVVAGSLARQALAVWQGPPFGGLADSSAALQVEADRLQERRLVVLEQRIDADLTLGRHADVVAELTELVWEHPLRERFQAQLMLALYRSRRQAEALKVYRRARALFTGELGLEPGAELTDLAQAILRTDPALDLPAAGQPVSAGPRQLPAAVPTFTGRTVQLRRIDALVAGGAPVVVVSGTAGVGKTALVLQWAHGALDRFPDGQLYLNLHGCARSATVTAAEALVRLVRSLGVPPDRIPVDPDELAALYRSELAGKRILVVLDNAGTADQVRPLLPGRPGSLVVVTGRQELPGLVVLHDAGAVRLDLLTEEEGLKLLARLVGAQRVKEERRAAATLVRLCAGLPLALRIAAADIGIGRDRPIGAVVDGLRADRLDRLGIDGDPSTAVRAAFELSYRRLGPAAQGLFRLLGVVQVPDFTARSIAVLAGDTSDALAELERAHLVARGADGRYQCHDLLRLYATERARAEDDAAGRDAARLRLFGWYLATVTAAVTRITPQILRLREGAEFGETDVVFEDDAEALEWLEAERACLMAIVHDAAAQGPHRVVWLLADALRGFFWLRRHSVDWITVAKAGLAAAVADGEPRGRIAARQSLAQVYRGLGDYAAAVTHYTRALELATSERWPEAEAAARGNLAGVHWELGALDEAVAELDRAIELNSRMGWEAGLSANLHNIGTLLRELGKPQEAIQRLAQALSLIERNANRDGAAHVYTTLGEVYLDLGRLTDARESLSKGVSLHRENGARYGEATALCSLAALCAETGDFTEAAEHAEAMLELARETGDRRAEANALAALAELGGRAELPVAPEVLAGQAVELAHKIHYTRAEIVSLLALAEVCRRGGRLDDAVTHAGAAAELAARRDFRLLAARAQTVLATTRRDRGDRKQAAECAERALTLHRRTGNRIGEGHALAVLGEVTAKRDPGAGQGLLRKAHDILADCGSVERFRVANLLAT
ncbi:AfsR family transcriptional regulator [Amycolatopsis sp. WAC 04169]|uniref:AfsR/SARP family transcriptional regulator n=1 Tax=Amycolatopsis sp. WAC 04169 TaxID=2203197 RepID=UPI000F792CF9|nr:BTAD domain-containing putative transcriptional regulator [Amycolatopsis sp. WAC 04169]RSN29125.1 AfsR family transcriptional regulator [Amycolatopsis sp. WAC 04169]